MKKLILTYFLLGFLIHTSYAQEADKVAFQVRMNNHVTSFLKKDIDMMKAKELYGHTCDVHHIVTEDEIRARAAEAEKNAFIHANMAEYKKLFFPQPSQHMMMTDTFICDNGGFEDDFDFYYGFTGSFSFGSDSCTPYLGTLPSSYIPKSLPTFREFEIATTGSDVVTGQQKVKFGSKSLKLNDLYNHLADSCSGSNGMNKLVKRFKVTEDNRDFTVWYSLALENPSSHNDQQPFFNISCDLAPSSELCFDADILRCDSIYNQPGCNPELMDVLDWTCHRIKIPKSEIGNIATLEIVMADCGRGGHNGYAYIDGICEECDGSTLGTGLLNDTIDYFSCDGLDATVCGTYELPDLCNIYRLDSIVVPGFNISNLIIDTINKTFCFDVAYYSAPVCQDLFAYLYFSNGGFKLPAQLTNSIEICRDKYWTYAIGATVGDCHNNDTPLLSDDYYFVKVKIDKTNGDSWDLERQLDNPYQNEDGQYTITSGVGDDEIYIGPFLVQEGDWTLTYNIGVCMYEIHIEAPNCTDILCKYLSGYKITNVKCDAGTTWSFKLDIPDNGLVTNFTISYALFIHGGTTIPGNSFSGTFGMTTSVSSLPMLPTCITFNIIYNEPGSGNPCSSTIIVCPPKPCDNENCDLDVDIVEIFCSKSTPGEFSFDVDATTPVAGAYLCYQTVDKAAPMSLNNTPPANTPPAGPFDDDIELIVYLCSTAVCSDCLPPRCFKVIYIPKPDCAQWESDKTEIRQVINTDIENEITIYPNPLDGDEIFIKSSLESTAYEIFNSSGELVTKGQFSDSVFNVPLIGNPGLYIVRINMPYGKFKYIKVVKI